MYKRIGGFAFFILLMLGTQAQVSVSLQEPPTGIVQKDQLWNLALINSGNATVTLTIGLSLFDVNDNQVMMTAFSKPITLAKGVKQVRAGDVAPVQYNYFSSVFNTGRIPDGFLPIGNYRACYSIYADPKSFVLTEDCMTVEVQPLSPPQLNLPSDSALLETTYPQFSWLPPTPVTLFTDLNYDLLVTEMMPGQSPGSAIQENLPVYSVLRTNAVVNNYPGTYKSLDTGKIYAWRVVAKNGEMFAGQSEIWTFRVRSKNSEPVLPENGTYIELKPIASINSPGAIVSNILGLKYYSYDRRHTATLRFLNEKGELIKQIDRLIEYGNNFLLFRLDHSFSKETVYFVEITDLQSSRYRASFSIIQ